MAKISFSDYFALASDISVPEEKILEYSIIRKGKGGFDFELKPDPKKVELSEDQQELENALQIGNGLARWRRKVHFRRRLNSGENLPVLVSEGDSWFQFPLLIKDVVDQLGSKYLIYSVGAAGDTAQNMVFGSSGSGRTEYMTALGKVRSNVRGFLFSAAGNDIIGEDPETGVASLFEIIRSFNGDTTDVQGHINHNVLGNKIEFLKDAYRTTIKNIRDDADFRALPIIIHGYDYAFPYPFGQSDPRNPVYAKNNEWLGEPLDKRGIKDDQLRRNIIKFLVDELYDMLIGLSGNPEVTCIWVVDCRGAMSDIRDWNDEIHGTNDGFTKVAARFQSTITKALAGTS